MIIESTSKIIIIYGPPCSGKSTLSNLLKKNTGFRFLSTDLLRLDYFTELKDLYNTTNVALVYDTLFRKIRNSITLGISIIVEGMFLTNKNKERVFEFSDRAELKFVYVTASFDTLSIRLKNRNKLDSGNILQHRIPLSVDSLRAFYDASKPPVHNDLIIDTGNLDLQESFLKLESIISKSYSSDYLRNAIFNEANDSYSFGKSEL